MEKPTTTDHNPDRSSMCLCCWKHPRYHLVAKSMDHFTRKKMWEEIGIPQNSKTPKICGIPASPIIGNQGCRTCAEFPYLTFGLRRASSELPLPLADIPWQGVRKIVSQKRQSSENPAKTCGLFKCLGLLSVWVDDKLWIKRQPKM